MLESHNKFNFPLHFSFWNINGIGDKIYQPDTIDFLFTYDIFAISESQTACINYPGYVVYSSYNTPESCHRGGVLLFIKNYLYNLIESVNTSHTNIVIFSFKHIPRITFYACYFACETSLYYDINIFSLIQNEIYANKNNVILFGDLNSRFGQSLHSLVENDQGFWYENIKDKIKNTNKNARSLKPIIMNNDLIIVNNLCSTKGHTFEGDLTFKKSGKWISEIDLLISSKKLINQNIVKNFKVMKEIHLPSNHAPVCFTLDITNYNHYDTTILCERAQNLGNHAVIRNDDNFTKSTPKTKNINILKFTEEMSKYELPVITNNCNIDDCVQFMSSALYNSAMKSKHSRHQTDSIRHFGNRWDYLINCKNEELIWKAINWKGEIQNRQDSMPNNDKFKEHYETLLYDHRAVKLTTDELPLNTCPTIPILDNIYTPNEIINGTNDLKDSAGHNGVHSGLYKYLPISIILFITYIINTIYFNSIFPKSWCMAKLFNIFKKGDKQNCNNYRGICVLPSFAKLYDKLISNRLKLWFKPKREQAGNQTGRSCMENILCLRLLICYSLKKKLKLYVCFIDFTKAYDRVPRFSIIKLLIKYGCSALMICAITSMYESTTAILGTTIILINIGVRQGAPSSGILFTLVIDELISMLNACIDIDGFLSKLNCLAFMDDLIIFSTTREGLELKLNVLNEFCQEYGMQINEDKSEFFVINNEDSDKIPFICGNSIIKNTNSYTYLGCIFNQDGSIKNCIEKHAVDKHMQFNKLCNFLRVNFTFPFYIKKKVFNAAYNTSLLYSCESWFNTNCSPVKTLYMNGLKQLLGVRYATCNILTLNELNYPPLEYTIKEKQRNCYKKLIYDPNRNVDNDPFYFTWNLCYTHNIKEAKYMKTIADTAYNFSDEGITITKFKINSSNQTKIITYRNLNPTLDTHPLYTSHIYNLNELHRISFSRLRLSSHDLLIERGRWARPIIDHNLRLCHCGLNELQDEPHVIEKCLFTSSIRANLNGLNYNYNDFFNNINIPEMCKACYMIMNTFSRN